MSATVISAAILTCMVVGVAIGRALQTALPGHHLAEDSKDTIKIATGLLATLTALVLGLLVSSASGTFNTQKSELNQAAAEVILLDRYLAQYGPETAAAREQLRGLILARIRHLWPDAAVQMKDADAARDGVESLQAAVRALSPRTAAQKDLQAQAAGAADSIAQTRWLLAVQHEDESIPLAFIAILALWTSAIFTSFSLFAPRNSTTTTALLVCIVSVSGAVFLILELGSPYGGAVRLSPKPLQVALEHLGRP